MIDITPIQIESILPVLTDWLNEKIDEFVCEDKLKDMRLNDEEIDFVMTAVNTVMVDTKGVETVLIEAIELANHNEEDDIVISWEDDQLIDWENPYDDYIREERKYLVW